MPTTNRAGQANVLEPSGSSKWTTGTQSPATAQQKRQQKAGSEQRSTWTRPSDNTHPALILCPTSGLYRRAYRWNLNVSTASKCIQALSPGVHSTFRFRLHVSLLSYQWASLLKTICCSGLCLHCFFKCHQLLLNGKSRLLMTLLKHLPLLNPFFILATIYSRNLIIILLVSFHPGGLGLPDFTSKNAGHWVKFFISDICLWDIVILQIIQCLSETPTSLWVLYFIWQSFSVVIHLSFALGFGLCSCNFFYPCSLLSEFIFSIRLKYHITSRSPLSSSGLLKHTQQLYMLPCHIYLFYCLTLLFGPFLSCLFIACTWFWIHGGQKSSLYSKAWSIGSMRGLSQRVWNF